MVFIILHGTPEHTVAGNIAGRHYQFPLLRPKTSEARLRKHPNAESSPSWRRVTYQPQACDIRWRQWLWRTFADTWLIKMICDAPRENMPKCVCDQCIRAVLPGSRLFAIHSVHLKTQHVWWWIFWYLLKIMIWNFSRPCSFCSRYKSCYNFMQNWTCSLLRIGLVRKRFLARAARKTNRTWICVHHIVRVCQPLPKNTK